MVYYHSGGHVLIEVVEEEFFMGLSQGQTHEDVFFQSHYRLKEDERGGVSIYPPLEERDALLMYWEGFQDLWGSVWPEKIDPIWTFLGGIYCGSHEPFHRSIDNPNLPEWESCMLWASPSSIEELLQKIEKISDDEIVRLLAEVPEFDESYAHNVLWLRSRLNEILLRKNVAAVYLL